MDFDTAYSKVYSKIFTYQHEKKNIGQCKARSCTFFGECDSNGDCWCLRHSDQIKAIRINIDHTGGLKELYARTQEIFLREPDYGHFKCWNILLNKHFKTSPDKVLELLRLYGS